MDNRLFNKDGNLSRSFDDTVEVKIFQNKNNKQFNLPVLKKSSSPRIIRDILGDKDIIGLTFKITNVIRRDNKGKLKGGRK